MSTLRFVCPKHQKEADSGIETDRYTYEQCRGQSVQLLCPLCNDLHDFAVKEGRIDELHVANL